MAPRRDHDLLGLFEQQPGRAGRPVVHPAAASPEHAALAQQLRGVRLGTSSWAFPGWQGQVYRDRLSREALSSHGLMAYAAHPLLQTVSIDSSYYRVPPPGQLARYAEQVPDSFRFVVKAPMSLAAARVRGQASPHALSRAWVEAEWAPRLAELGGKLGAVLLQVPPQPADAFGPHFYERLASVLSVPLPWVVEVRTRGWVREDLAHVLRDTGACPCLSIHPSLPDLRTQWRVLGVARASALHIRWNLAPGRTYEDAKAGFAPFDRLQAPDIDQREALAKAIGWALDRERPVWVVANNKAEGSAPATLWALAACVGARRGA